MNSVADGPAISWWSGSAQACADISAVMAADRSRAAWSPEKPAEGDGASSHAGFDAASGARAVKSSRSTLAKTACDVALSCTGAAALLEGGGVDALVVSAGGGGVALA